MPFNNRAGNHGGFANPGGAVGIAAGTGFPDPVTIGPYSRHASSGAFMLGGSANLGSVAWAAVNLIELYPFELNEQQTVSALSWWTMTAAGNGDIGIYDVNLARLVSAGSTALAGADAIQTPAIGALPLVLAGGYYYLAFALSDIATARVYGSSVGGSPWQTGMLVQTGTFPLPATITTPVVATQGNMGGTAAMVWASLRTIGA